MIDGGIPAGPAEWPESVLERLRLWEQADVVRQPPLFYFADPLRPVWAATALYADESQGPEIVVAPEGASPPYGLVTTQTCDIAEEDARRPVRPWVQVAPVYSITDKGWRKKLLKGRGPQYWVHLPDLPDEGFWIADLRIEMPVEKGWLALQQRIRGIEDENARRSVGLRIGYLRSRSAFSSDFNRLIYRPLEDRLVGAALDAEAPDDATLDEVAEVVVQVDSFSSPSSVFLTILSNLPLSTAARQSLEAWRESIVDEALDAGIDVHPLAFQTFVGTTAAEYRMLTVLWRAAESVPS